MDYAEIINNCQGIYRHIQDEESIYIFEQRLLYSLTGNYEHIKNIVMKTDEGQVVDRLISGNDCYIFGAGLRGKAIKDVFFNNRQTFLKGFLDNSSEKQYKDYCGLPVYPPSEIVKNKFKGKIIIPIKENSDIVISQLISLGVDSGDILNLSKCFDDMADKQYFSLSELPHCENEVFCDIGCFNGESAIQFEKWSGNSSHIYCFEPDPLNVPKVEENLNSIADKVTIIEKGVWSSNTKLHFNSLGNISSNFDENGDISVDVAKLDDVLENKEVTFIKMDIEGSEYQTLLGAENIIKRCKPKLAICIYHKYEDIFEIPKLILKFNPDYRFYLRHYSISHVETVLYAVDNSN